MDPDTQHNVILSNQVKTVGTLRQLISYLNGLSHEEISLTFD